MSKHILFCLMERAVLSCYLSLGRWIRRLSFSVL